MSFRDADGATVPMRVLHIRAVLLMHLQKAAINGSLKKPDHPDVPVKFKNLMDWKDATNALKRSLCACCLRFAQDSTRFNDVRGTSGNAPIHWALSQDMPETKENHAFMNAADSLLREHLTEPLVIHDADGAVFGTFDCSDWQSVIGDCHSNEAFHACNMSGDKTCWLCTKSRKDEWLDFKVMSEEQLTSLETVRKKISSGEKCTQFSDLPAVLLGNGETPVDQRGMEHCQGEPDYLLHHRTGLIKTYLFWAIVNFLSAKEKELLRRKFQEEFGWQTFMEYMDGANWHLVLIHWDKVVLPFVKNYKAEYSLVRYHLLEILVIIGYDHTYGEQERRVLSLAV
eukprot:CAMPEP_0185794580 /NCGR_PEP_ID=MMETSP1174-20130828/160091_1 /TAXON_ID=35687 /ORGANISM="Dictyocha speculum, Strain CCMP1381" /LENGTH=340 /DNA_ID=CAMNT_0028489819 /DNA_START=90 /DNA_END=1109 /DNA_ORIENTATION=+